MSQLRWNPFRELEEILDRYNRAFSVPALQASEAGNNRELITRADWLPAVDIIESDAEYLVKAELPDVQKENVKVNVNNGVLSISGERRLEKEEGNIKHRRIERVFGSFSRSFTLPDNVDENAIRAEYRDGVLSLHVPKMARPQSRAIEVQVH